MADTLKALFSKKDFLSAWKRLSPFLPKNSHIAALRSVLVEASGNAIALTATDLDCRVRVRVPAEVSCPPGTIACLPGAAFATAVKTIPEDRILVGANGANGFVLSADIYRYDIETEIGPGEMPVLTVGEESWGQIPAEPLAGSVSKVLPAASKDAGKYNLSTVLLDLSPKNGCLAVASDGHRLACAPFPFAVPEGVPEDLRKIVVPVGAAAGMVKFLDGVDGDVAIGVSRKKSAGPKDLDTAIVHLRLPGGDDLWIQATDARFPDYTEIVPKAVASQAIVARDKVAKAIRFILQAPLSDRSGDRAALLRFSAQEMQIGSVNGARAVLPVETYSGKPVEVGFNPNYLSDAIAPITGNAVRFRINGDGPAIIDGDDTGYLTVVMPTSKESLRERVPSVHAAEEQAKAS